MIASLLQDQPLVEPAPVVVPEIIWSAIAPNLVLMLGGVLLLTVVSLVRGRTPQWFPAAWTVAAATFSFITIIPYPLSSRTGVRMSGQFARNRVSRCRKSSSANC